MGVHPPHSPARPNPDRSGRRRLCAVVAAMGVALVLGAWGLGNHAFWDDEANTAIFARNLLRFGRLTAWDGRNLLGYAYGRSLGEELGRELRIPGLPAYLAAAGMWLVGENTLGGRLPFLLCGVLAVGVLAWWARGHLGRHGPWWLGAVVLAISPAWLLYIRNCRYYALGALLTLLLWALWVPGRRRAAWQPGLDDQRSEARSNDQGSMSNDQGSMSNYQCLILSAQSPRPCASLFHRLGRTLGVPGPWIMRAAAGVVVTVLLISTHYLNAAAALASLPVFFVHRGYRRRGQLGLLAVIYAAAVLWGVVILWRANPFAAQYMGAEDWLFGRQPQPGYWQRFWVHLGWLLRDLGTHEFVPWGVLPLLALPWMAGWLEKMGATGKSADGTREKTGKTGKKDEVVAASCSMPNRGLMPPAGLWPIRWWHAVIDWLGRPARRGRLVRLRALATRAWVLVGVILLHVLLGAALTPPDMAKGPLAEMRYVVPLVAVGAVLGAVAVAIAAQVCRLLGIVVLVVLVGSNLLHLGFLAQRSDLRQACWPPTLWRYVWEQCHDYQTGNEHLLALLEQLPPGTTVRSWPTYLVHPPMFYVPKLCYCDQLSEAKPVVAELRAQLPDYVFVERAEPELVVVPAPWVGRALWVLERRFGRVPAADSARSSPSQSSQAGSGSLAAYRLARVLPAPWAYSSKPEIPNHFFEGRPSQPPTDWNTQPGLVLLVRTTSPLANHPALKAEDFEVPRFRNLGLLLAARGWTEAARASLETTGIATEAAVPRQLPAHGRRACLATVHGTRRGVLHSRAARMAGRRAGEGVSRPSQLAGAPRACGFGDSLLLGVAPHRPGEYGRPSGIGASAGGVWATGGSRAPVSVGVAH